MIKATNLKLIFGSQKIFNNISFDINQEDRVGLVGRNGSGKTTLLKAISDPKVLDAGQISIIKNKKIAYMPQEVVLESSRTIFDETFSTFEILVQLLDQEKHLDELMASNPSQQVLEEYANLQEKLSFYDIEDLKVKTKEMLLGLGFSEKQLDDSVATLSVGWKMRIVLAKLLLQNADFYLFDEPTNHLDLIAKEWFLSFLKGVHFGFLIICHEKYFLDELCEKILELEQGKATVYTGNYSEFIAQKERNQELLESAFALQQKDLKRQQAIIDRFKASASKAKMAQSMMKKMEKTEKIVLPSSSREVNFKFPVPPTSGKVVITAENVSQSFGEKEIFKNVSFEVLAKKKLAIIAPNGGGKTTLFNLISKALPLQAGSINFGYNVEFAIFAQDQNKALTKEQTIIDNIRRLCPLSNEQTIRSFLGAFLFSGDDVLKKVSVLSGGEKNRVGMVSVLLQKSNLLLLDEPTNHLDIPSKEILLKALQEYQGTIIFVSHDRDFVNDLATDILELSPNGSHWYIGNYDEYVYQRNCFLKQKSNTTENSSSQKKEVFTAKDKKPVKIESKSKNTAQQNEPAKSEIEILSEKLKKLTFGTTEFYETLKTLQSLKRNKKS